MKTDKFQIVVDHLVRITQEITEIKSNQQQFSEKLEQNSQAIARIEHNHGEKLNALSERLDKTNQAVARIEHDHGEKLNALSERLDKTHQAVADNSLKLNALSERLDKTNQAVADNSLKLNALSERLDKTNQAVARIEHDHGKKLNALFDAREIQLEVNDRILNTLSRIEEKLDHLSSKVAHHDLLLKKG